MRFVAVILGLFVLLMPICAQQNSEEVAKYSMVDVKVAVDKIGELEKLGLPLDCCWRTYTKDYVIFSVPLQQSDIEALQRNRFAFSVTVDDAAKFYAERLANDDMSKVEEYRRTLATEMKLGSMKGYYTIEEISQTLDALYAKYGSKKLITQKKSIGKTVEGRDIYMVKISDNADKDEGDSEKQVLYTALTHAREPAGMMTVFYFMYYLLENYETNQRVRSIVDGKELYFVPVVNADGYAYNQKNSPNGGGMWRKNRQNKVDLNRNFGPREYWDYPNGGSSTSSSSDTYRGPSEFSENETAALRDFAMGKNFRTALNYHTYSNLLIYPWGIKDEVAHPMFKTMAIEMTKINGYRYGTAEGLLYAVRGGSDDFFYKVKNVFSLTPEAGGSSDGFWPSSSRIFPLAQENLEANLLLAEYADKVPAK